MKKRFTLRLTEEEYKELSRIKTIAGISTNSDAIRYAICHLVEMNNRCVDAINKNTILKSEYKAQDCYVENLLKSIEGLKELQGLKTVSIKKK